MAGALFLTAWATDLADEDSLSETRLEIETSAPTLSRRATEETERGREEGAAKYARAEGGIFAPLFCPFAGHLTGEAVCQSNNLLLVLLLRDASAAQCCSPAASAATQPRLFNFHALPLVSLARRMVRSPSVLFAPLRLPAVEK